jgi:hypothetical protein
MESKAPVTFREHDAETLRKAADDLENLHAILDKSAKLALAAVLPSARRVQGVDVSSRRNLVFGGSLWIRNHDAAMRIDREAPWRWANLRTIARSVRLMVRPKISQTGSPDDYGLPTSLRE